MIRGMVNTPFWMLFYGFFIVSFLPYFFIRFGHQSWVYELLYRPNGIVENMTVLLYVLSLGVSGWVIYKFKSYTPTLLFVAALSLFMFGEEVRWGLYLIVDNIHDVYVSGVQDILVYAVRGAPEHYPFALVLCFFIIRILLFLAVGASIVYVWYHRHNRDEWIAKFRAYPFSLYLCVYALLMFGVIILELFIQPGARKLDYIEETFELNAALVWFAFSLDIGPDGGDKGGMIVAQGTPEEVSDVKKSYTGHFLKPILERRPMKKSA